jgi:hypothetical protein
MLDQVKENGIKIVGETVVAPGASLLLDGNIKAGGAHIIAGIAAKLIFGRIGWMLVALNSFSKSATGRYLHQQFRIDEPKVQQPAPTPVASKA